jgi:hypothetical protein
MYLPGFLRKSTISMSSPSASSMPATSSNVTRLASPGATRRAVERPKPPRTLPAHQPDEEPDEQDRRAEAEEQGRQERAAAVGRLGVDHDAAALELLGQVGRVDERGDLGLEEVDLLGLAPGRREARLLLEIALDRLPARGDLLHVAGLDLLQEEGRVRDLCALLGPAGDERGDEVEREQADDQRDPLAVAREHRRLGRRRRAAAVRCRLDPPPLGVGLRRALGSRCWWGGVRHGRTDST